MKRIILAMLLAVPQFLHPCTSLSFVDNNNDRIFGKAFDWHFAHGMLFVNKRNVQKEALMITEGEPLRWASRFGSISFNQHGRDFPLGGMNEAGLVVEIMVGPTQDIPASPSIRNVNEVQIIQYLLDSYANIEEVTEGLQDLRIARVVTDVHYLVCDKNSDCTTIEFLQGKLVQHKGADLPYNAFTNSTYEDSARYASNYLGLGGTQLIPSGSSSLDRFVRAAAATKNYRGGDAVSYVHKFLNEVSLSGRWRIAYQGLKEIHFVHDKNLRLMKSVSMNQDFSCSTPVKVFGLEQAVEGDIQSDLETYTVRHNQSLVNANFLLPANLRKQMIEYPETHTKCLEDLLIED